MGCGSSAGAQDPSCWGTYPNGDLCSGPGSYYLNDESITVLRRDITTLEGARRVVEEESIRDPENPVVLYQLTDPWFDGTPVSDGYVKEGMFLVFHRKKFLEQNLDDHSPDLETGFAKDMNDLAGAGARKSGSPIYFRRGWPPDFEGWGRHPNGDICCGPGSYYLDDESITVLRRDVVTLEEAHRVVVEESSKDPQNPVVLFQLTDPGGGGQPAARGYVKTGMFLVFHRQKFLAQNLDDHSPDLETGFPKELSDHPQPTRFGSPVYYRRMQRPEANAGDTNELEDAETNQQGAENEAI